MYVTDDFNGHCNPKVVDSVCRDQSDEFHILSEIESVFVALNQPATSLDWFSYSTECLWVNVSVGARFKSVITCTLLTDSKDLKLITLTQ